VGLPCSEGERTRSLTAPARGTEGGSLEWWLHYRVGRRAQTSDRPRVQFSPMNGLRDAVHAYCLDTGTRGF
jgi:hypothetical protein